MFVALVLFCGAEGARVVQAHGAEQEAAPLLAALLPEAAALQVRPGAPGRRLLAGAATHAPPQPRSRAGTVVMEEDDYPSDTEDEVPANFQPPSKEQKVEQLSGALSAGERGSLAQALLGMAASTNRGETSSAADLDEGRGLVRELEALNPIAEPTLSPECQGTWELVWSDTQLFRSSPFFMAGRAVCADGEEATRYDMFCDLHRAALAISTIGKVRQIVGPDTVVSEFETSAGAVPFLNDYTPASYSGGLPFTIDGAIVSTASIEGNLGDAWRLLMDTVEVKGSNIPGVRQALDAGVKLQTRDLGAALETVVPEYANPRPLFRTTYLDGSLRVSRDQDDKIFLYRKVSGSTEPTDYSAIEADLGVGKLLQQLAGTF